MLSEAQGRFDVGVVKTASTDRESPLGLFSEAKAKAL
jgi:hypothetical protein